LARIPGGLPPSSNGDSAEHLRWTVRPPQPSSRRSRRWIHPVLLLATLGTTTMAGALHYASFVSNFGTADVTLSTAELLLRGLTYSLSIIGILGAHEMGHYLTCRYYGVDATLPFFIPAPLLTGTLGAVIRIRGIFPTRAVLFDIAVAGPIAGFLVLVPLLFAGLTLSTVEPLPANFTGYSLGEPLLFRWATWLVWGNIPDGYSLNMHPMVFASWFGLFATALNLLPFGQLDGGHATYAALGPFATIISRVTVVLVIALNFFTRSWMFVTALLVAMLFIIGARHPPVLDETSRLDQTRRIVFVAMIAMFVVCFTPWLIEEWTELIPK
jgi:membrane-associated protease RseP (regulator of RpoE activity)